MCFEGCERESEIALQHFVLLVTYLCPASFSCTIQCFFPLCENCCVRENIHSQPFSFTRFLSHKVTECISPCLLSTSECVSHVNCVFARTIHISAKYNRTEGCVSGLARDYLSCCVHTLHVQIASSTLTFRPVLKHGPRSSTGLRVVEASFTLILYGEAKAICHNQMFHPFGAWPAIYGTHTWLLSPSCVRE